MRRERIRKGQDQASKARAGAFVYDSYLQTKIPSRLVDRCTVFVQKPTVTPQDRISFPFVSCEFVRITESPKL
jgi:hypothetical protein